MTIDEEVVLSDVGRAELLRELKRRLKTRMEGRRERDRCVRRAFEAAQYLKETAADCSALCRDLGFTNEEEAYDVLVHRRLDETPQVASTVESLDEEVRR